MSTWRQCNTADEDDRFCLPVCRDSHTSAIIHVDILGIARRIPWCSLHPIVRAPHMVLCRMPMVPSAAARQIRTGQGGGVIRWVVARFAALPERVWLSGPSGRPRALCVGRFEDGCLKDRPCRHVGRPSVSGDTKHGLEVSILCPQTQCPRQIVLSTPRHSYEAASRNGNRSAGRQTDMLIRRHDDMSDILLLFVSALTHIGVMLIRPENSWLYPIDW